MVKRWFLVALGATLSAPLYADPVLFTGAELAVPTAAVDGALYGASLDLIDADQLLFQLNTAGPVAAPTDSSGLVQYDTANALVTLPVVEYGYDRYQATMTVDSNGNLLFQAASVTPICQGCADFSVVSTVLSSGTPIPSNYTCEGEDLPPPLYWNGAPNGTTAYAVVLDDPATGMTWVHWNLYNLPASAHSLPTIAALPAEAQQGPNDFGTADYGGPCPPEGGGAHTYRLTLFALTEPIDPLPSQPLTAEEFESQFVGNVRHSARLTFTYAR